MLYICSIQKEIITKFKTKNYENFQRNFSHRKQRRNTLWAEGVALLNWVDKNASEENKESFVEWAEGDFENVEKIGNYPTTEFFENAPSWEELK